MSEGAQPARLLLPDAVLTAPTVLQRGVALVIDGWGRISALTPVDRLDPEMVAAIPDGVEEFPGELWAAAPLMMHAHLESYDAPSSAWSRDSFSEWVQELLAWRQSERMETSLAVDASLAELAANGCGLVLCQQSEFPSRLEPQSGSECFPEALCWPELFAPSPSSAADVLEPHSHRLESGVSLHAPFSVSPELATLVFASGGPVSLHFGEHPEERQALMGFGSLCSMLQSHQEKPELRRWNSPVEWLQAVGGLRQGVYAVHCGDLNPRELQDLALARVELVWCPGTHQYFNRPRPAFAASKVDAPLLGCDSRASNSVLDPMREVSLASSTFPEYSPTQWWEALTSRAATSLSRTDVGALEQGRRLRALRSKDGGATTAGDACADLCHRGVNQRIGLMALS